MKYLIFLFLLILNIGCIQFDSTTKSEKSEIVEINEKDLGDINLDEEFYSIEKEEDFNNLSLGEEFYSIENESDFENLSKNFNESEEIVSEEDFEDISIPELEEN